MARIVGGSSHQVIVGGVCELNPSSVRRPKPLEIALRIALKGDLVAEAVLNADQRRLRGFWSDTVSIRKCIKRAVLEFEFPEAALRRTNPLNSGLVEPRRRRCMFEPCLPPTTVEILNAI